jgi:integrase
MRKRLDELGEAARLVEEQARKTSALIWVGELGERLRRQGVDLGVAQQLLGHARPATTMRYGQPTEADVREALRRANGGVK